MHFHRVAALLGLARQGFEIGREFGTHSLEALAWIGLAVEQGVYQPHAFVRTSTGIRFTLANPPLRCGAFSACRVGIDGRPPESTSLRWRNSPGGDWRAASDLTADNPLHLRPGEPTEFEVDLPEGAAGGVMRVRLEFQSVAIPPLVWLEFSDTPRPEGRPS